jgi:hypothetical protein
VRRVQQLTTEGVIPRTKHGQYEIAPAVRGYIRYLRERSIGGDARAADEVGTSRALLLKSRARMATLEADQFEGLLLNRSDVEKTWGAAITNIRTRMLAIPPTTAPAIVYLTTPAQIANFLTQAVAEALDDISTTPIYTVPDQRSDAGAERHAEDGATAGDVAAATDGVGVG